MSEKLSLIERLRHFQQNRIDFGDQYGAEILHHTIVELVALEAKLEAMERFVRTYDEWSDGLERGYAGEAMMALDNNMIDARLIVEAAAQEE